jgi:hypothetical protein
LAKKSKMKDLVLIYPKENKSLVKKIVSKLEFDGVSCWVAPRDFKQEEKDSLASIIKESKILLLIIDKTALGNGELYQAIKIALENEIEIIPFVIEKIEANLYTEFFLNKLSWIDAYKDSFEEAYDLLVETYKDITGQQKIERKKPKQKDTEKKKLQPIVYLIAAIIILVLGYFIYDGLSTDKSKDPIVGKWSVSDYYNNQPGNTPDSLISIKNYLKKVALLVFNEDHTFERRGFSKEPEIGKWELNPENTILYLTPNNSLKKDVVNLEKLNDRELVIIGHDSIGTANVTSRVFFTKNND